MSARAKAALDGLICWGMIAAFMFGGFGLFMLLLGGLAWLVQWLGLSPWLIVPLWTVESALVGAVIGYFEEADPNGK